MFVPCFSSAPLRTTNFVCCLYTAHRILSQLVAEIDEALGIETHQVLSISFFVFVGCRQGAVSNLKEWRSIKGENDSGTLFFGLLHSRGPSTAAKLEKLVRTTGQGLGRSIGNWRADDRNWSFRSRTDLKRNSPALQTPRHGRLHPLLKEGFFPHSKVDVLRSLVMFPDSMG